MTIHISSAAAGFLLFLVACLSAVAVRANGQGGAPPQQPSTLGAFSVSLAVKDLEKSRTFYEQLDFRMVMGDGKSWLILRNGSVTIGLFQGALDRNTLTFNPGWSASAQPVARFTDVREHQRRLKSKGMSIVKETDENASGPGGFLLIDPDGNPVLIDQHVPAPPGPRKQP